MLKWILASLVVAMFCGTAQAGQEFTLMANTSPPYADAKLPEQGLALELVKTVFAKTAFTPKITIENWSRALEGT